MGCPPYAKIPSGELISVEWLTSVLRPDGLPADSSAPIVTSFEVDTASVIEGRHSTTFRLYLEWSSPPVAEAGAAEPAGVSSGTASDDGDTTPVPAVGGLTATSSWRPMPSVFVKRMTCNELPARSLIKWRTSIASYRAESTFFKTVAAGSHAAHLDGIVPHAFWVHVDDRLGDGPTGGPVGSGASGVGVGGGGGKEEDDAAEVKTLRESCFMMITEDLGAGAEWKGATVAGWEQVGALDLGRARGVLTAVAHLHAAFWPKPEALVAVESESEQQQQPERHPDVDSDGEIPHPEETRVRKGGIVRGKGGRYAPGLHEQGTFWSLEKRDPGDLAALEETYQRLLESLRPLLPPEWFSDGSGLPPSGDAGSGEDADVDPGTVSRAVFASAAVSNDHAGGRKVSGAGSGETGDDARHRHRALQTRGTGVGGERHLGRRLAARAVELDAAAHAPSPSELRRCLLGEGGASGGSSVGGARGRRGRSLVHGDLKTWNVFFSTGGWGEADREGTAAAAGAADGDAAPGGKVKIIDWQWCGEGLAAADVAYVVCTSLEPSVLLSSEGELLTHYHAELCRGLETRFGKPPPPLAQSGATGDGGGVGGAFVGDGGGGSGGGGETWYSFQQFLDDYRVGFLDYMRCVVGTLWKGLTPEKMERNRATGPGLSLINRSPRHLQWMIEKATLLLDELDGLEGAQENQLQ